MSFQMEKEYNCLEILERKLSGKPSGHFCPAHRYPCSSVFDGFMPWERLWWLSCSMNNTYFGDSFIQWSIFSLKRLMTKQMQIKYRILTTKKGVLIPIGKTIFISYWNVEDPYFLELEATHKTLFLRWNTSKAHLPSNQKEIYIWKYTCFSF